ncbi:hypothetical protein [Leuconostoc citreum]|uniref:hypothetical protein n=1 Tax=Leuconostoc citreum TaxID=33964 RepID=UPI000BFEE06B|nr:hypothetical protein [Leuconostoc citreum]
MKIKWTEQLVNYINQELLKGRNFPAIARELSKDLNVTITKDDARLGIQRHADWIRGEAAPKATPVKLNSEKIQPLGFERLQRSMAEAGKVFERAFSPEPTIFKATVDPTKPVEIKKLANGDYSSARTLNLSDSELRDENALLRYHGYDPEKWDIKTSSNSRNERDTNIGVKHSYLSRITVKPKTSLTIEDVRTTLLQNPVTQYQYSNVTVKDNGRTLVIPLFDLHFGITKSATVTQQLNNLIGLIVSNSYEHIVIVSGGDVLHSDVVVGNSKTTSGTLIDPVNMKKAIKNAEEFYDAVIQVALQNSKHVSHYAIAGNHDMTTSYMLYLLIEQRYPQVETHLDDYRLTFTVGNTGILIAHGNLAMKDISLLFATQYPEVWNKTTDHEIYSGHVHTKSTVDQKGVLLRSFGTVKPADGWEVANGYVGNRKSLEVMEYSKKHITASYYL